MKTSIKLFALGMILMGFGVSANAQNSASANATATGTIVAGITITKTVDMNFGNVVLNGAGGGTVALAPDNTPTYGGNVLAFIQTGIRTAAQFDITGTAGYTFLITYPASIVVKHTDNATTMTVNTFTSNLGTTGSQATLDVDGKQSLKIGATLNVAASQKAGVYTSAPFAVTVAYN